MPQNGGLRCTGAFRHPVKGITSPTKVRNHEGDPDAEHAPRRYLPLADNLTVTRMGYGAMQLAGPHVFGPPADRDGAVAVLREVVELGITHIDTSDFYGPHVTNQIIREALHPYPGGLRIVTKVGSRRDAEGGWPKALAPDQLRQAVRDNLTNLDLEALDIVNLRVGGSTAPRRGPLPSRSRPSPRCSSRGSSSTSG